MSEHILVVEDDRKIGRMISDYLSAEGYQVTLCTNGADGLEKAYDIEPDAIILDIMLPGINGFEILRVLRRSLSVPILMLTAKSTETDRVAGLDQGADDYIVKPFSLKELVARVRAHLRRAKSSEPGDETISLRDLIIDVDGRRVRRNSEVLPLTEVQFQILLRLAKAPGRVFTRMQLLESFQEAAFEGYERTIDVHIKNIRKAIEVDPRRPRYITTVRGVGYRAEDAG